MFLLYTCRTEGLQKSTCPVPIVRTMKANHLLKSYTNVHSLIIFPASKVEITIILHSLLCEMKIVTEPLPPQYLVDTETRVAVCERQEEVPAKRCQSQNNHTRNPRAEHALSGESLASRDMPLRPRLLAILDRFGDLLGGVRIEDKLKQSTRHERGGEMSREIVM